MIKMEEKVAKDIQDREFDVRVYMALGERRFLEVVDALPRVYNHIPKCTAALFLVKKITPFIFNRDTDFPGRARGLQLGFVLLNTVNVTDLTSEVQETAIRGISDRYLKVLEELSENDAHWDQLWVYMVKLLNTKLHSNLPISNKLLRLMEKAFRNHSSYELRLKAYDCWRELIDNFSLDKKHMFNDKKMQLLMTPLKIKLKRIPAVISKRLEVFVHLLKQIEENVPTVLTAFLITAFGPFDNGFTNTTVDSRNTPEMCKRITALLMEIIGHSHGEERCLDCDEITFDKPLVDQSNFNEIADVLIKSVLECSCLLYDWNQNEANNRNIVKCLWCSLMKLMKNCDETHQAMWCKQVEHCLSLIATKMEESNKYQEVLTTVLDVLASGNIPMNYDEIFESIINILKNSSAPSSSSGFSLFELSPFSQPSCNIGKIAMQHLADDSAVANLNFMAQLWLHVEQMNFAPTLQFMVWPLKHLDKLNDQKLLEVWSKLYNSKCDSETKLSVIQQMEKLFASNPLLSANIVAFVSLIDLNGSNPVKEFMFALTKLIVSILTLPNVASKDVAKLIPVLMQLASFYQHENDECIAKFCQAVDRILLLHKKYDFLENLEQYLKTMPAKLMGKMSKHLLGIVEKLRENDDAQVVSGAEKVQKFLEPAENNATAARQNANFSSRVLKMFNMSQNGSPSIFSASPIRGSQLALVDKSPRPTRESTQTSKEPPKTTPKKKAVEINDDKSSDFVKFDTVVKFDPSKLSEHQKEVMKRRRDDIPAMYQDLSQSQSMDFSNSNGSNNKMLSSQSDLFSQQELRLDQDKKSRVSSPSELGFIKKSPIVAHYNIVNNRKSEITSGNNEGPAETISESKKGRTEGNKGPVQTTSEMQKESAKTTSETKKGAAKSTSNITKGPSKTTSKTNAEPAETTSEMQKEPVETYSSEDSNEVEVIIITTEHPNEGTPEIRRSKRESVKEKTKKIEDKIVKQVEKRKPTKKPTVVKEPSQDTNIVEETPQEIGDGISKRKRKPSGSVRNLSLDLNDYKKKRKQKTSVSPKPSPKESPPVFSSNSIKAESSDDVISPSQKSPVQTPKAVKSLADTLTILSQSQSSAVAQVTVVERPQEKPNAPESLPDTLTAPSQEPPTSAEKKQPKTPTRTSPRNSTVTSTPLKSETTQNVTIEELPTSPITNNTSLRNDELMESTRDISPISFTSIQEIIKKEPKVILSKRSENILKMVKTEHKTDEKQPKKPKARQNLELLSFSREIPSPLAMPMGGILKRKLNASGDDPIAPSPKRKRVSFPIPAITARKVFLKENEDDSAETSGLENGDIHTEQADSVSSSMPGDNQDALLQKIKDFSASLEPEQLEMFMHSLIEIPKQFVTPKQYLRMTASALTDLLP